MNRQFALAAALCLTIATLISSAAGRATMAQGQATPVPLVTLAQPTPLPLPPSATPTARPAQSGVTRLKARIGANGKPLLLVGIPYNVPPFARITETGVIEGFEADLARAIAEDWGTDIEFRQVTRQNALNQLLSGQVDFLIGQVIVSRDTVAGIEFTEPYFTNRQVVLAMADAQQADVKDLNAQPVGVVSGSRAEAALDAWAARSGTQPQAVRFNMLDDALQALFSKQIVALVGDRWELDQRVGGGRVQGLKLLTGIIRTEPYGIAFLRHDDSMRTLLQRTLMRLSEGNRLEPIFARWFPGNDLDSADKLIPRVWRGLKDDTRTLNDFRDEIFYPETSVVARLQRKDPLRVAGLGATIGATGQPSPLEGFNQAIITEMARRWGVPVVLIPNSAAQAVDLLASGQADVAVGLEARWDPADRIDFAGLYAQGGYKLMVRVGSNIQSFAALFEGRTVIGLFSDDAEAEAIALRYLKEAAPALLEERVNFVKYPTDDDAVRVVFENNVRVFFADAFRLLPVAQRNTPKVSLTERLYEPRPYAFGLPRNDADFRALIEITLQQMAQDGTYERLYKETFNIGSPLTVTQWPGTDSPFGMNVK